MAEAFLKKEAGNYFDVYSGGYNPKPIHPMAIQVMKEIGYDISGQKPKDLWQLSRNEYFGIVITVCKKGEEEDCPTLPGPSTRIYWNIEDPAAFEGTEDEKLSKFRQIRDQIYKHVRDFLEERKIPIQNN
jgi:arsenate reductase